MWALNFVPSISLHIIALTPRLSFLSIGVMKLIFTVSKKVLDVELPLSKEIFNIWNQMQIDNVVSWIYNIKAIEEVAMLYLATQITILYSDMHFWIIVLCLKLKSIEENRLSRNKL